MFLNSGNIFINFLFTFSILLASCLKSEDITVLHIRNLDTRDLYSRMFNSLFMNLKFRAMNPNTLLIVLQHFSVCYSFCLKHLFLATVDWICYRSHV